MHVIELYAENYKRLRVVEINPKGRMIQITGKNGQGKTSVLDAIWAAIVGAKAIAEKPVRKGADKARIRLDLGEFILTRTIKSNGEHSLTVENAKGTKVAGPQKILDELLGALTFDPLAFVQMKPKEQVETLRSVAKIELDVDALNAQNKEDYENRRMINRDIDSLRVQVQSITVQEGLPKQRLDEKDILSQLETAGEANKRAQEQFQEKERLEQDAKALERLREDVGRRMMSGKEQLDDVNRRIEELRSAGEKIAKKIDELGAEQAQLTEKIRVALKVYQAAPEGTPVDVAELTMKLQNVQLTNREIDKRGWRLQLEDELKKKEREAEALTRAMEQREEQKREAITNAKMPVDGLTFDENQVIFNGIPLGQLGEAEQIRISTSIAMAANPKLRVLRILNGEALDEDNLKVLTEMAEKNDFQIWMAKVDSSGKCGIVMEDGMVKAANAEAE